jgi:hypothetical protein
VNIGEDSFEFCGASIHCANYAFQIMLVPPKACVLYVVKIVAEEVMRGRTHERVVHNRG